MLSFGYRNFQVIISKKKISKTTPTAPNALWCESSRSEGIGI
nr:MAG TPA: hypothetical protein [Caudoviricetes sp.]